MRSFQIPFEMNSRPFFIETQASKVFIEFLQKSGHDGAGADGKQVCESFKFELCITIHRFGAVNAAV